MNWDEVSRHHQRQLLDLLFHHMQPEMRRVLMREVPAAYNQAVGHPVVSVIHCADGTPVRGERA